MLRPITYADELAQLTAETHNVMLAMLRSTGAPRDKFRLSAAKVMWEIKNSAFSEEGETRLIFTHPSGVEPLTTTLKNGATITRKHRAVDTGIREYCEIDLTSIMPSAISEVILGPRSDSHVDVVKRMLCAAGCTASVYPSTASYR